MNSSILVYIGLLTIFGGAAPDTLSEKSTHKERASRTERGVLVSYEQIGRRSQEDIAAALAAEKIPGIPKYGVILYRVTYQTVGHEGKQALASGAIAVPDGLPKPAPLLAFHHGTVVARQRVPSVHGFDLVSMGLGSSGYVTVLPDYLGLGVSEGLHPYVHAKSLSTASVDMLRAARAFCNQKDIDLSDQLFLMGYSEGGYATMAVHREIEEHYHDEFTVTASAPMAGPYNLSEVMVEQILEDAPYPSPGYLPFTLLAYDMLYDVYDQLDEVIIEEYAASIEALFDGEKSIRHINRHLPEVPRELLTPTFIKAMSTDPSHPFRQALKENDVHHWKPVAPMRLYHCVEDDQVSYRNAEKALKSFRQQGAEHVELAKLSFGDHNECAPPALFLGKLWFDGFVNNDLDRVFQANAQIIRAGSF